MSEGNKTENIWVAVSIVVAGLIIAAAVIFTSSGRGGQNNGAIKLITLGAATEAAAKQITAGDLMAARSIQSSDHTKGDVSAPIQIIEYSDTECPFCKNLHNTLNGIVTEYAGSVVWAYRHLPLSMLHRKAVTEAHATECAAAISGNEGFWKFTDALYETTPSNDGLDLSELPSIAESVGIDVDEFYECMDEQKQLAAVQEDYLEAIKTVGPYAGTPFSLIILSQPLTDAQLAVINPLADQLISRGTRLLTISADKTRIGLSGAMPKEVWVTILDAVK